MTKRTIFKLPVYRRNSAIPSWRMQTHLTSGRVRLKDTLDISFSLSIKHFELTITYNVHPIAKHIISNPWHEAYNNKSNNTHTDEEGK